MSEGKISITQEDDDEGADERLYSNTFYCPITKKVMNDPVVLPDGESYERNAVLDILLSDRNNENDEDIPDIILNSLSMKQLKKDLLSNARECNEKESKEHKKQKQVEPEQKHIKSKNSERDNQKLIDKLCEPFLYPNRALRIIIQGEVSTQEENKKSTSIIDSIRKSTRSWLSESSLTLSNKGINRNIGSVELSDKYYCPITSDLMRYPVIDIEGNTYERFAIETWLKKNSTSPVTRSELPSIDKLYKNNAIRKLLQEEKNRPYDLMHPSVRRLIADDNNCDLNDLEQGMEETLAGAFLELTYEELERRAITEFNFPTTHEELERQQLERQRQQLERQALQREEREREESQEDQRIVAFFVGFLCVVVILRIIHN